MNRIIKKSIIILPLVCIIFFNSITAYAKINLEDGSVKGLPENITVLDSDGNSVSSSGEYFFYVENMQPSQIYSKDIEIMNLRNDKAYNIYFYAEPVSHSGDFNLEEDCVVTFSLDTEKIFNGRVNGLSLDKKTDMSQNPINLGSYKPGQSRNLNCEIVWNLSDIDATYNNGRKLVSHDGTVILEDSSGNSYVEGEVVFKWIFYAVVDDTYVPPQTGILSTRNILLLIMAVLVVLIMIMIVLIVNKKKCKKGRNEPVL